MDDFRVSPQSIVICIATPWEDAQASLKRLSLVHEETWVETLSISQDANTATFTFENGVELRALVEEPIPELYQLAPRSLEPYGASDLQMLKDHRSIVRIVRETADVQDAWMLREAVIKLASTFEGCGASGAFLPGAIQLHSPRTIQRLAMDPSSAPSQVNFFISATHQDDWMRTRGLTAFGLPELETQVTEGLNAAYFTLLDTCAQMLFQGRYPDGARLVIGPHEYQIHEGPVGPADEAVPIAGTFGVMTIERYQP